MAQQESGWVLEQHPDPETFRRVWARVMPDGEGSPIALEPDPSDRTTGETAGGAFRPGAGAGGQLRDADRPDPGGV